jgi:cystathionine gamma-synthase
MAQPESNPNLPDSSPPEPTQSLTYSLSTLGVHGDDPINSATDVAPPLHVSTTYRYPNDPSLLKPLSYLPSHTPGDPILADSHVYSRATAPNTSRLELILTQLLGAPCLSYASGLAAFHALIVYLNPKVIAIGAGYHGCHGVLNVFQKLTKCKIVDLFDEKSWDNEVEGWSLGKGDVVHLETPVNPTGNAYDIRYFAEKAHARGASLTIDATFAPPPLLDPFKFGADFVMHSGTKYFGGHSDMLCGVVGISKQREGWEKDYWAMFGERVYLGAVMGNMEGWLGVRSLRTLELRVLRQSESAGKLVWFLNQAVTGKDESEEAKAVKAVVASVEHASLQEEDMARGKDGKIGWLKEQMPNGFGPVFGMHLKDIECAKRLPSKLHLFHHATSLGGVESLIEWRKMSDATVAETLVRVSIGVENWEDLKRDIVDGCKALVAEKR